MEGNPRDSSDLQARKLWVLVVVRPIIAQMCPTPCQIRVQVARDNNCNCESFFFFFIQKKKNIVVLTFNSYILKISIYTQLIKINRAFFEL